MSEIRKPMVLVFAGPNGSGKSTITEWFNVVGKYTNADDMVRTSFLSNEEATKRADDLRYESIRKREDFTFETVLSSDYKIRILKTAKEAGYFIKCVFVLTTSANLNVARVKSRVAQFVKMDPDSRIDAAYARKEFGDKKPSLVDYMLWTAKFVTHSDVVEW